MEINKLNGEILIPQETIVIFTEVWNKSLFGECADLLNEQSNLKLINIENWMSLNAEGLFNLCLSWKRKFLGNKKDKNTGSLEWLFCILRHNVTNYDSILDQTAKRHAWAPAFGTLLRLQADYLIISFLHKYDLYDQIVRTCQDEWMWRNSK
jgi:hypothetical protein